MGKLFNLAKGHPACAEATRWQIYKGRIRERVIGVLDLLHVPAALKSADINDDLTGDVIRIRAKGLFTKITINGRDYYFDRLTGRFDGTGLGCDG